MIRLLALLLCASLAACSSAPRQCTVEALQHDDMDLKGVQLPTPMRLNPVTPTVTTDHVELSFQDWASVIQWQHEVDRYLRDLRGTWADVGAAVATHNAQYQPVLPPAPPPKTPSPAWWQIWRKLPWMK